MTHMPDPPASTSPTPRFRWLKRFAVGSAMLLVLLVGLRLHWGQAMQRKVDLLLAQVHAQGEPIYADDLEYEPVDDHENAAIYLMQALNIWPTVSAQSYQRINDTDWFIEGPDAGYPDPVTDNAAYLKTCAPALDLVRQAAALRHTDWLGQPIPQDYNDFLSIGFTQLADRRRLARLMQDAATRAFDSGQTALGFEILNLIYIAGDRSYTQPTGTLDVLVGLSIQSMTIDDLQNKLPTIRDEQLDEPLVRQQLIELRDRLLDEAPLNAAARRAAMIERWLMQRYLEQRVAGSIQASNIYDPAPYAQTLLNTPVLRQAFSPLFNHTRVYQLEMSNNDVDRYTQSDNYRDATDDSTGPDPEEVYHSKPWLYPIVGELWFMDTFNTLYRSIAMRRMAATAIAIRLYQLDHEGQRPAALDALVPDYLPAVPVDPYVGDRPIGYKPEGVVPRVDTEFEPWGTPLTKEERAALPLRPFPLLYCVGTDLKDNGGRLTINEYDGTLNSTGGSQDENADLWFLLVPEPDALPAQEEISDALGNDLEDGASERGKDDVEEEQEPGEDAEDQAG